MGQPTKGHIHQEKKNLQSTKTLHIEETRIKDDQFPTSETPNKRTNQMIYAMLGNNKSRKGYIDLAGKFPFVSNKGNQYILVAYNYDANHISAIPIKIGNRNQLRRPGKF